MAFEPHHQHQQQQQAARGQAAGTRQQQPQDHTMQMQIQQQAQAAAQYAPYQQAQQQQQQQQAYGNSLYRPAQQAQQQPQFYNGAQLAAAYSRTFPAQHHQQQPTQLHPSPQHSFQSSGLLDPSLDLSSSSLDAGLPRIGLLPTSPTPGLDGGLGLGLESDPLATVLNSPDAMREGSSSAEGQQSSSQLSGWDGELTHAHVTANAERLLLQQQAALEVQQKQLQQQRYQMQLLQQQQAANRAAQQAAADELRHVQQQQQQLQQSRQSFSQALDGSAYGSVPQAGGFPRGAGTQLSGLEMPPPFRSASLDVASASASATAVSSPAGSESHASKRKRAPSALALASKESEATLQQFDRAQQQQQQSHSPRTAPLQHTPASSSSSGKKKPASSLATSSTRRLSDSSPSGAYSPIVAAPGGGGTGVSKLSMHRTSSQRSKSLSVGVRDGDADDSDASQNSSQEQDDEDDEDHDDGEDDEDASPAPSSSRGKTRRTSSGRALSKSGLSAQELKVLRLARKAELARLSRRQKKDRLGELETENEQLRNKIAQLEKKMASMATGDAGADGTSTPAAARKKKLKSEEGGSSASNTLAPGSLLGGGAGSTLGNASPHPLPVATSPLALAEQLQGELGQTTTRILRALRRIDGQQQQLMGGNRPAQPDGSAEADLQALSNRMLELQNSRCMLSAEMSHAYESMLYSAAPSASAAGVPPLAGLPFNSSDASSIAASTSSSTAGGVVPLHFLQWLLSQPSSFYADPNSLWLSLWHSECLCDSAQLHQIAQLRLQLQPHAPLSGEIGGRSVHARLLLSFEHFRSLLMAQQQEELSLLQQLLHILTPVQFAKYVQFAMRFAHVITNAHSAR